jgi:GNAT superfamily N-acetyltransferase
LEIARDTGHRFRDYAAIPAAFMVRERIDLSRLDHTVSTFATCPVSVPWTKDYDAVPGNAPTDWPARFVVDTWLVFHASVDSRRVGSAIVVTDAHAVASLGGRAGGAVLWDLRVAPDMRGRGIGRALLAHVEGVAVEAGCHLLDIETQDINVPACRLYAATGYELLDVAVDAYTTTPGEARLTWTKRLMLRTTSSLGA